MKSFNEFGRQSVLLPYLSDYISSVDGNWNYITPEELFKKDLSKLFLLDVRKRSDYNSGHISGSKNIFWKDLLDNLELLPVDRKVYLICYVGHTSSQVMVILSLLGYDVVSLKFGMGISPVEGVPVAGWSDFGFNIDIN